jgi:GNAT superfamily N-acetyltransferase
LVSAPFINTRERPPCPAKTSSSSTSFALQCCSPLPAAARTTSHYSLSHCDASRLTPLPNPPSITTPPGGGGAKGKNSSKSSSKAQADVVTRKVAITTKRDLLIKLRNALFLDNGKDKIDFGIMPMLMEYKKKGLNLKFSISAKLLPQELNDSFRLIKENMETIYDDAEYGWDDQDKMAELTEKSCRFLIATDVDTDKIVAFAHFRLTQIGECLDQPLGASCVYVYDLQVRSPYQRKGVGKHIVALLTMIGRKSNVATLCLPIVEGNNQASSFLSNTTGFTPYNSELDALLLCEGGGSVIKELATESDQFQVYTKVLINFVVDVPPPAPVVVKPSPAAAKTAKGVVEVEKDEFEGASPDDVVIKKVETVLSSLPISR